MQHLESRIVHHQSESRGHFYEDNGKLKHVNGEVEYFDFCQVDYMSLIELDDFARRLGYERRLSIVINWD